MTRKRFGLSQDHRTRYALISQGYKLILDIASGNTELYEPGSDPQELLDLSATEIDTAEKLRQQLLSLISENEELRAQLSQNDAGEQIDVLTEDEVDDLKSIGCLR